jgi:hypothetical protein
MKHFVNIGQTNYTVLVHIRDATTGQGKTGLDEADIDLAYARVETDNDVTVADVTPASLSALTDAHADWGFEEVDNANAPGLYRLDIADAVFATGAWSAAVYITDAGSNNFIADPSEFQLVGVNQAVSASVSEFTGDAATQVDAIEAEVGKIPRSATALTAGVAKFTRTGGATDVDEVTIEDV